MRLRMRRELPVSPVTVSELTTEVTPEPAPTVAPPPGEAVPAWEELERARRARSELVRLEARTRAEGFDA
jgi:hypothetical protein